MKDQIVWFIVAIIYLATLYSLVRPNSKGSELVATIFGTFTDLVRGVSGQTYNPSTQKWSVSNG